MSETSVTIKYGKGHDDSWVVFRGTLSEIRANIMEYFGMDPESQRGLSLDSIVINATNIAHSKGLLGSQLGATVTHEQPAPAPAATPSEDPWVAATANQAPAPQPPAASEPKAEDPDAYVIGLIAQATTVEGLKRIWAENQALFNTPLLARYKEKGKELQAAAA
ncbi:hypothetical protein [Streptodolium elevatio]|uniref:Uncharacterized protein n=1 Tax=Streptodolium elevatio TaxID=3157996 RepID=A0ABV3DBZ6_9ACTN